MNRAIRFLALAVIAAASLAGRPRERVGRALAPDPAHPGALEMAGSAIRGDPR